MTVTFLGRFGEKRLYLCLLALNIRLLLLLLWVRWIVHVLVLVVRLLLFRAASFFWRKLLVLTLTRMGQRAGLGGVFRFGIFDMFYGTFTYVSSGVCFRFVNCHCLLVLFPFVSVFRCFVSFFFSLRASFLLALLRVSS